MLLNNNCLTILRRVCFCLSVEVEMGMPQTAGRIRSRRPKKFCFKKWSWWIVGMQTTSGVLWCYAVDAAWARDSSIRTPSMYSVLPQRLHCHNKITGSLLDSRLPQVLCRLIFKVWRKIFPLWRKVQRWELRGSGGMEDLCLCLCSHTDLGKYFSGSHMDETVYKKKEGKKIFISEWSGGLEGKAGVLHWLPKSEVMHSQKMSIE